MVVAALLAALALWRLPAPAPALPTIAGSPSARVAEAVARDFATPFARPTVMLVEQLHVAADSDEGRAIVRRLLAEIDTIPGVTATHSPATSLDTLLLSGDRRTAIALIATDGRPISPFRYHAVLTGVVDSLHRINPRLNIAITGPEPLAHELADHTARALRRAEWMALPLSALAAWFAFGSWTATLAGVLSATAAALVALAAVRLLGTALPLGGLAEPVAVMVAIALALDYFLWRRRGGFAARDLATAAAVAATAFAALLLAPTLEVRGAAVGGLVAVAVAMLVATSWRAATRRRKRNSAWLDLVPLVLARPWPLLAVTLLPLGLFAWRGAHARLAIDSLEWLPNTIYSANALHRLDEAARGSAAMPSLLLVGLPEEAPATSPEGWRRIDSLVAQVRRVPRVGDVRALTTVGTGERTVTFDVVPEPVLGAFVSRDRRQALLHVVAGGEQTTDEAMALTERLRAWFVHDSSITVGGFAAMAIDHHDAMHRALLPLAVLASIGTALALMVAFRAPVIAVKAVTLNLLVALAAIGVVSLFAPAAGLPVTVPVAAFGTAFALSIDYELLLLFGVRRAGRSGPEAIARGLADAAPLMWRGGLLLIGVLAGFVLSGFAPLALLGAVLAVAIAVDIVVVRPLIAPALLVVLGRWNWWPGRRAESGDRRSEI